MFGKKKKIPVNHQVQQPIDRLEAGLDCKQSALSIFTSVITKLNLSNELIEEGVTERKEQINKLKEEMKSKEAEVGKAENALEENKNTIEKIRNIIE